MSIDSDHVNYLVYRYMLESGFQHSSFTFAQECGVTRTAVANIKIPPGSLVAHLQRALNYVQAEVNLTEDGRPAELEDLEAIEALNLIESVQPQVCEQRRQQLHQTLRESNGEARGLKASAQDDDDEKMEMDLEVAQSSVVVLKGHESEVVACTWNPAHNLLATGSGDSTARIWNMATPTAQPVVLRHLAPEGEENKDVTTLDWNSDGSLLATGSYDGAARIWTFQGDLKSRLAGHNGPIFSLKWNRRGTLLVTSGVDQSAIVWVPKTGQIQQRFSFHAAPCLDVAWSSDSVFASCSTDKTIYVCQLQNSSPVRTFKGHDDEVNAICWDSTGTLLASCSDDASAKIWSLERDDFVHNLTHRDKIYSIKWGRRPAASGEQPLMLASASCDNTTKIWDANKGTCMFTLTGHTLPVYSVSFSPNGLFLASGSFDNCLFIWSMKNGELLQTYHGGGGIFEVCWNGEGSRVAACYADNTVAVVDFRRKK